MHHQISVTIVVEFRHGSLSILNRGHLTPLVVGNPRLTLGPLIGDLGPVAVVVVPIGDPIG